MAGHLQRLGREGENGFRTLFGDSWHGINEVYGFQQSYVQDFMQHFT